MRILVADDENEIRNVLRILLKSASHEVILAQDGERALEIIKEDKRVDLVVMDIMMPRMSGIDAARKIRDISAVPILFLTAKSLVKDKEAAYASGGDDYIVKPFSSRELLMKVDALTRRYNSYPTKAKPDEIIELYNGVSIDTTLHLVKKGECEIEMRDKEYEVLLYLAKNRGRTVAISELYRGAWADEPMPNSGNTITVHVLGLRRKLEDDPQSPRLIRTVWGKGYQID